MEAGSLRDAPRRGRESGEVQSVARASMLLARVAEGERSLTLSELARETELSVSTAYRLLNTLCAQGLLCRDSSGERYLPGPLLMRLARSSLLKAGFADVNGILAELAERSRETVSLGVLQGDEVAIVLTSASPEPLRTHRRAGERAPVARSAIGRALLAFSGVPAEQAAASAALTDGGTAHAIRTQSELVVDLLSIQFRGWALLDEEELAGVRSLAVPIPAAVGVPLAGVELQGPTARIDDRRADELGELLRDAALTLSQLPLSAILA